MNKMKVEKLANGIQVISKPLTGLKAVTIEVMVGVGSKYEKVGEHGLSHFLEHMMFKGTKKRPTAELINKEVDAKGAISNAGTGQEMTSYYITTVAEHRRWAIDLLSDVLINSKFDESELMKERGVIAEEIKMYQDNPMSGLSSDFMEFIWGESKVGCWNISGGVKEVLNYRQNDVINFWKKYYSPKKVVIVVAGDLQGDETSLITEAFESWPTNDFEILPRVDITWATKINKQIERKNEQGHFVMGLPGIKSQDCRRYEFKILDTIVSGNSSSRLFQKVREDRGLAYYIYSVSESISEAGVWAVQSGVVKKKMDEAMDLVEAELMSIGNTVSADEVGRVKEYIKGKTRLAMDRSDFWTSYIGEKLLLENRLVEPEEELKKVDKVTVGKVKDLAKELTESGQIRTLKLV